MYNFIKLAFKNVFRQKKRSFTLGINYAVVAFILVLLLSFSAGATRTISTSLVRSTAGHITLTGQFAKDGRIYNGLLRADDLVQAVRETFGQQATTAVRYSVKSAVYYNGLSKRLSFSGIDTAADSELGKQARYLEGSWEEFVSEPSGILLPKAEAEYFGLSQGDEIILSSRTRFGAFNTGILKITGIYESDNFFAKGLVLAHFDQLLNLDLAEPGSASSIFVYLPSTANLDAKRDDLRARLEKSGFETRVPESDAEAISAISSASTKYEEDTEKRDRVIVTLATLDEVLGIVRTVLAAVNGVGAFIAAVMLFVIAVSIFINLRMSISERLREIGTMRAMGLEADSVTFLFVAESVGLALIFSAAGSALAVLVCYLFRLGPTLPADGNLGLFLVDGKLMLHPQIVGVLGVILVISAFAAVFSFFPARKGGAIPPVQALTNTF